MSDDQSQSSECPPCRDFERGVCSRGDRCKFFHPEGVKPTGNGKLPICKDYQNKNCFRSKCKFLHITIDEEAEYNRTGNLPAHGGLLESTVNTAPAGKEVCKDFLNDMCSRGNRCKFAHISEREVRTYPIETIGMATPAIYGKRQRADEFERAAESTSVALAEENEMLKRKITELQREVMDLRQMNDILYEQNTKYRTQLRSSAILETQVNPYAAKLSPAVPVSATDMVSNRLAYAYDYSQYLH